MRTVSLFVLTAGLALVACTEKPKSAAQTTKTAAKTEKAAAKTAPEESAKGPTADAMATAQEVYAMRCATCHGAAGLGDGPAAAALNARP